MSELGWGRHGGERGLEGEVGSQQCGLFRTSILSEDNRKMVDFQRMRWVSNGLKQFLWPMCGEQVGMQPLVQQHWHPVRLLER